MPVLSRLALDDIVDTTKCAWESPETALADAMTDVHIGALPPSDEPGPAAAAIGEANWAPHELARLHAWASANSAAGEPMDLTVNLEEYQENYIPPPFLVLSGTESAQAHRTPTAKKAKVLSGKRPSPYMPPTVYFGPPPVPSKRTVQLKKASGAAAPPAQARPKPPSCAKKVRVPRAEAEALHAVSIALDPANVVCSFAGCGYLSADPGSHRRHMLSHAEYAFPCPHCPKVLSSQTNLDNHVKNVCKAATAA